MKIAQQIAFPFKEYKRSELIKPKTDEFGNYWECCDCNKQIRDLSEVKHYKETYYPRDELITSGKVSQSDLDRLKTKKEEFIRSIDSTNPSLITSAKYLALHQIHHLIAQFVQYNLPEEYHNKLFKIQQTFSNTDDNETIINYIKEVEEILSKVIGTQTYDIVDKHVKVPMCPECYDEIVIYCANESCDFESVDKEDFTEFEDEHYCSDHIWKCNNCGNVILETNLGSDDEYYCNYCFSDLFGTCERCGELFGLEDGLVIDDEFYCQNCKNMYEVDERGAKETINKNSVVKNVYPIDEKSITGNLIPVLAAAIKKFNDQLNESSINFILGRLQKEDVKAAFKAETKDKGIYKNTISEVLESFKNSLRYSQTFKEKYPKLKGFKPIPCNIGITGGGDHIGSVFFLYPNDNTFEFAEAMCPGARLVYDNYLESHGHHDGALAYIRISKDQNDNIIVDNIQTDIDVQWVNKLLAKQVQQYKEQIDEIKSTIKFYEEQGNDSANDYKKTLEKRLEQTEKAINTRTKALLWWANSISKFFVPMLLDIVKQFGEDNGHKVYLTSMEMQRDKWQRLPDKVEDFYESIPELMGFEKEEVEATAESLGTNRYIMRRVAKRILRILFRG